MYELCPACYTNWDHLEIELQACRECNFQTSYSIDIDWELIDKRLKIYDTLDKKIEELEIEIKEMTDELLTIKSQIEHANENNNYKRDPKFMYWYLRCLKKYAVFSGRARRKEYWMFQLFSWIFTFIALILDMTLGSTFHILTFAYIAFNLTPAVAVAVRRLHDTGRSGWMYLIIFIPFIGPFWLLALMTLDGNPGENKYGPNPKGVTVRQEREMNIAASAPMQYPEQVPFWFFILNHIVIAGSGVALGMFASSWINIGIGAVIIGLLLNVLSINSISMIVMGSIFDVVKIFFIGIAVRWIAGFLSSLDSLGTFLLFQVTIAAVILLLSINEYLRGAWKAKITIFLSLMWVALLIVAFVMFEWQGSIITLLLSLMYFWVFFLLLDYLFIYRKRNF